MIYDACLYKHETIDTIISLIQLSITVSLEHKKEWYNGLHIKTISSKIHYKLPPLRVLFRDEQIMNMTTPR